MKESKEKKVSGENVVMKESGEKKTVIVSSTSNSGSYWPFPSLMFMLGRLKCPCSQSEDSAHPE